MFCDPVSRPSEQLGMKSFLEEGALGVVLEISRSGLEQPRTDSRMTSRHGLTRVKE